MQPCIVLVVDKPFVAKTLAPQLSARWPQARVFAITTLYRGLYEFNYLRGLRFSDFPYVQDPAWKPRSLELSPVWEIREGTATRVSQDLAALIRAADLLVYAGEPDASGVIAYEVLLTQILGREAALRIRPTLCPQSLTKSDIAAALGNPGSTSDDWFVACRNAGRARKWFDFNFNMNALALFGALTKKYAPGEAYLPSKYGLQLLYQLREQPVESERGLLELMAHWPGTGRYAPCPLGSAASRPAIIEGLLRVGLVARTGTGQVHLSETGTNFLQKLHPDCRDADLPARLNTWAAAWPESKPSMERYLRTFFGKQKRFRAGTLRRA